MYCSLSFLAPHICITLICPYPPAIVTYCACLRSTYIDKYSKHKVNLQLSSVSPCPLLILNYKHSKTKDMHRIDWTMSLHEHDMYVKACHRELNCNPSTKLWKLQSTTKNICHQTRLPVPSYVDAKATNLLLMIGGVFVC